MFNFEKASYPAHNLNGAVVRSKKMHQEKMCSKLDDGQPQKQLNGPNISWRHSVGVVRTISFNYHF